MEFKVEKLYASKNRFYKIIGLVFVTGAIAGATYPFWGSSITSEPDILENLGRNEIEAQAIVASSSPILVEESTSPKTNPKPSLNTGSKNRLMIATAGVDMPLFLSANDKALLKGGWMYSGNSTPDKGGNTVIFGHRWLYKPPIKNTFYSLDKVKVGDQFSIDWNGKTYNYHVSETRIVNPTEVSVLNPTNSPQVTLITCTPLFSTKQRLVVIGKLI